MTAAVLGIYEVKDGPYASREEGIAKHGGILPFVLRQLVAKA